MPASIHPRNRRNGQPRDSSAVIFGSRRVRLSQCEQGKSPRPPDPPMPKAEPLRAGSFDRCGARWWDSMSATRNTGRVQVRSIRGMKSIRDGCQYRSGEQALMIFGRRRALSWISPRALSVLFCVGRPRKSRPIRGHYAPKYISELSPRLFRRAASGMLRPRATGESSPRASSHPWDR
jgi:hypothetical protein